MRLLPRISPFNCIYAYLGRKIWGRKRSRILYRDLERTLEVPRRLFDTGQISTVTWVQLHNAVRSALMRTVASHYFFVLPRETRVTGQVHPDRVRAASFHFEGIATEGRDVRVLGLVLPLIIGLLLELILTP